MLTGWLKDNLLAFSYDSRKAALLTEPELNCY